MDAIAIVGGGWLGQPLAHYLATPTTSTLVTRTSQKGIDELSQLGLNSSLLKLPFSNDEHKSTFTNLMRNKNISVLIGCFPPGFRKGQSQQYLHQWRSLVDGALAANINKVIMISSTTVYPQGAGVMTESDANFTLSVNNERFSSNARIMLEAEQTLIQSGLKYTIIRCAGLFGPSRHPGRFVSKLSQLSTLAPANMLHLTDALGVIKFSLNQLDFQTINAASPDSVSKAMFYKKALQLYDDKGKLPPIVQLEDKKISSQKLIQAGYQFTFNNAISGLTHCR